jgi:hypothetical protein
MMDPVPLLTVGDLKTELSKWSDDTTVTFYSPLKEQELRFYRYSPGARVLVLEVNEFPEHPRLRFPERKTRFEYRFFSFSLSHLEHLERGPNARSFKVTEVR